VSRVPIALVWGGLQSPTFAFRGVSAVVRRIEMDLARPFDPLFGVLDGVPLADAFDRTAGSVAQGR